MLQVQGLTSPIANMVRPVDVGKARVLTGQILSTLCPVSFWQLHKAKKYLQYNTIQV